MKLLSILLRGLLPFTALATASAPSPSTTQVDDGKSGGGAVITLRIPVSNALPNPYTLSPSTHATVSASGHERNAWLSTSNTFVFRDVPAGSYLVDFYCVTHAFAPLRLDVDSAGNAQLWETYRGNDWANKGEAIRGADDGVYDVRVLGTKGYFVERAKFNIFGVLKNPMVLLGLVSMGIFLGMPYLVDNMDPEMRAEWEERQKTNPMNGIMGAATGQPGGNSVGNFDMAAFLAGSSKKDETGGGSSPAAVIASGSETTPSGGGGKSGKGRKGR